MYDSHTWLNIFITGSINRVIMGDNMRLFLTGGFALGDWQCLWGRVDHFISLTLLSQYLDTIIENTIPSTFVSTGGGGGGRYTHNTDLY